MTNKHIPEEFADIFEKTIDQFGNWDANSFYMSRDNFFQNHRSFLTNGDETISDFQLRIERQPVLPNDLYLRFACATIKYYCCNMLNIPVPEWAIQFDSVNFPVKIPIHVNFKRLDIAISNTPEEFFDLGFIYEHKDLLFV